MSKPFITRRMYSNKIRKEVEKEKGKKKINPSEESHDEKFKQSFISFNHTLS